MPIDPEVIYKKIEDCFLGRRSRTCTTCPAHFSKDGPCCFGDPDKHDTQADCKGCDFFSDCQREAIVAASKRQNVYRPATSNTYKASNVVVPSVKKPSSLVQIGGLRPAQPTVRPEPKPMQKYSVHTGPRQPVASQLEHGPLDEDETMFLRFMKDSVTGALQGFFEQAADFWRNHRL